MKNFITIISIVTLAVLTMPAIAGHKSPQSSRFDRAEQVIDKRLMNQRYRIRDGIKNGELTHQEARRLRHQQKYIMRLTHRFMVDGYVDRHEFRELRHELDRASKRIYRLKHNNRTRYAHRTRDSYYY